MDLDGWNTSFWKFLGSATTENSNELEVSMKVPFFFGEAPCLTMFRGGVVLAVSFKEEIIRFCHKIQDV